MHPKYPGKTKEAKQAVESTLDVTVTSAGQPLSGAMIFLVTRCKDQPENIRVHTGTADQNGRGSLNYPLNEEDPFYVSAMSGSGTWYGASDQFNQDILLDCPPLSFSGPLAWWHKRVGIETYNPELGQGIHVGLVDSGVGPHPYLEQVIDLGSVINGVWGSDGADVSFHGTMMAGLIAARPTSPDHPAGVSPGSTLSSIRVYPEGSGAAKPSDVALAVEKLADTAQVDLINLSLSSEVPSVEQEEAIAAARGQGVLCIAAAGNDAGPPVLFPAAFEGVVAVGASGYDVEPGPTRETNAVFRPKSAGKLGEQGDCLSVVSSYGQGLSCIAPGTAIASTVKSPSGQPLYASQVGSSDAVAIVTAVLAAQLSQDEKYKRMPRNSRKALYAEQVLKDMCRSVGMAPRFAGLGIPVLGRKAD